METVGTTKVERNHERKGEFRKVGENLYRYSSSGKYYAVFRVKGKLFWKSLGTADREHAKRNLATFAQKMFHHPSHRERSRLQTLASWQGHRDGGVLIAKTYSHLRNEHSENMAKKLA